MNARTTTITTTLAAALVGALALSATAPAWAVTPSPSPSASASASPSTKATVAPGPTTKPTAAPGPTTKPTAAPSPTTKATPTARPTASATPTTSATTPPPVLTPTPTPTPTPVVPLPVLSTTDKHSGHTTVSRTATVTGTHLLNLAGVQIGGTAAPDLVVLSDTRARFTIPNAIDYQARLDRITVTAWSDRTVRDTGLTFQYKVVGRLDRQMAYAFQHWSSTSSSVFGFLSGSDCANFASQTLLARGWTRSPQWFNYGAGDWSGSWVSSTALSSWLKKRPDLATHLTYSQRSAVVVGDIVQFRWPGHSKKYSSWDHTAIVSKVVVLPNGTKDIYYVAHTLPRQYGGGTTGLAAWYAKQKIKGSTLRIQFFHLLK